MQPIGPIVARFRFVAILPLLALLAGCSAGPLDPAGDVAVQQRNLLIDSTLLMLVIIVPVMFLIIFFAWRYRQSNAEARYEPDWDHSTHLELAIWSAPLLIIVCLGALTWVGTHLLDPYRQIGRIADGQPLAANVSRSMSRSWRSTGSGCSSIRIMASRPSTRWRRRSIRRSTSRSPLPR